MSRHDEPSDLPLLSADLDPQGRESELEALLDLAERVLRAGDPADVATALLDSVVSTYGFARGAVLGGNASRLSLLAGHAVSDSSPGSGTSSVVELAGARQLTQQVAQLEVEHEPWLARLLPLGADLMVVPLIAEEHRLGALVLQLPVTLRGSRGRRVLREVERAAASASLALHQVQQSVLLRRLAATDDLTMIANRRSFMDLLERELARSVRSGEPVSLVILDIDFFKRVNDVHGHPAGDDALRNVAAALTVACRGFDIAARYGGEEFAVILPDCGVDRSLATADRIRQAVASAPAITPLTASAGVATFPDNARDIEQLVQAADEVLLESKRNGRNCTTVSTKVPQDAPGAPPQRLAHQDR